VSDDVTAVLAGRRRWAVAVGDVIEFLRALPDDSVDLLFTSPPYLEARTYGIGAGRKLEPWVLWMREVVEVATKKVKGLIAINCEGQTRNYRYLPAPFLLMADLHRAGFNLRKPVAFQRVGIPGSGGPDWLRNDWEPIVCVTRPGKLPWSDNTACGHPPKWGPGGEMSHRLGDGTRVNQWGKTGTEAGVNGVAHRRRDGSRQRASRPSHKIMTRERPGTHSQESTTYDPPVLANPGNVIKCNVGGGQMGHELASENEAPFPLQLAEFFVQSFCPTNGVVCDPFAGSCTTGHAAFLHGRRFVGCDIRESQAKLAAERMATVTPTLFAATD
jgi:hypothetical protein